MDNESLLKKCQTFSERICETVEKTLNKYCCVDAHVINYKPKLLNELL